MKKLLHSAFLFCLAFNTYAFDREDAYKVISIEGQDIPEALNLANDSLSLAAVFDGELEPIPYQIDEYNVGGAVYFPNWDVPINGEIGKLDATDQLMFLYKDAGPRKTNQYLDGKLVAEIELSNASGEERYVYLVQDSRLKADEQYVRYSSEQGLVETDFYSVTYDAKNHLIWKDFEVFSFDGENPLDEMKINWDSGVLTSLTRIRLSNENVVAEPQAVNVGPIRNTTQLSLTLYWLEVPLLEASLQLHHYPQSIIYDMRVLTPEFRRSALVTPKLGLSLDGNALLGAMVRTAQGPKKPSIVDGIIDQTEENMMAAGIPKENNWLYVSTNRKMDILAFFDFIGETDEPLSMVYTDDKDIQESSERYKGQLPNIGYQVDNFPEKGLFGFAVSLYIRDKFKGEPETFTHSVRSMPSIKVIRPNLH